MPWEPSSFAANTGFDVGSANSQDEFYGYGTGLMNPDQIVLDMSERIHMISADTSPFFSWVSGVRKQDCHNTVFSWMEDEPFGHRDITAKLCRHEVGTTDEYIYTLKILQGGDWMAFEAAAKADNLNDPARPIIHMEIVAQADDDVNFKCVPLLPALHLGPLGRTMTFGSDTIDLHSEIVINDGTTGGAGIGGPNDEVASLGANWSATAFDATDWATLFGTGDEVLVYVHTITPNEVLKGYAQGSGLPNSTRKRSRSLRNYTQIFKTSLTIANTLKHIRLYGGPQLARERLRKAVAHKVDIEYAILFQGGGIEGVDWGEIPSDDFENPLTRFKGLGINVTDPTKKGWIVSKNANFDTGFVLNPSTATLDDVNSFVGRLFDDIVDDPSSTKVAFVGQPWFNALSTMAMRAGSNGEMLFGLRQQQRNSLGVVIRELETPSGILRFARMPHFRGRNEKYGLVVDMKNISVRPLSGRDTSMTADAGEKYIDGQLDFFLTELGFELWHESTHAIIKLA